MSLQPLIQTGMLRFSKRDRALLEEIRTFPKDYDDALDALEMAVRAVRKRATMKLDEKPFKPKGFVWYNPRIHRQCLTKKKDLEIWV
jgi:hypothetical protein